MKPASPASKAPVIARPHDRFARVRQRLRHEAFELDGDVETMKTGRERNQRK